MNNSAQQTTERVVVCSKCQAEHTFRELMQARPVREGVQQMWLVCPDCGLEVHAYFFGDDLAAEKEKLEQAQQQYQAKRSDDLWRQYKEAQRVYQRAFDKFQRRWKRKIGVKERQHERTK